MYGTSQREALDKLRTLQQQHCQGQDLLTRPRTIEQRLTDWLKSKESDGTRPSTVRSYRWLITSHVIPSIGKVKLDRLVPADVHDLVAAKLASSLSPASVGHMLRVLWVALNDAEHLDLVTRNVAKAVRMPRAPKYEARSLTVEQARTLIESSKNHGLHAVFVVALVLGLRRGETLGLSWMDVNFDGNTIWVGRSLQRIGGALEFVPPKTQRSAAPFLVPPGLMVVLRRHKAQQQAERLAMGDRWPGTDLVFTSSTGTAIDPRNLNAQWAKIREQAGLDGLRLHDLRHSCATIMVALGLHPRLAMEWLRHSQISMTMNVYSHVLPEMQQEVADAWERPCSPNGSPLTHRRPWSSGRA